MNIECGNKQISINAESTPINELDKQLRACFRADYDKISIVGFPEEVSRPIEKMIVGYGFQCEVK